jgi:uncharacterized protein YjaZ
MDRTWTLHWLQAAGTLAPWRPRIRAEIAAAFTACGRLVAPPRVDVVIHQIPHWPIPELGFGGSSPSATTLFLAFDTANPAMESRLDGGLRRIVLHEAHHCLRHAGPGYGATLAEALVSEGLADHFVLEAMGGTPDPWCTALDAAALRRVQAQAVPALWEPQYDHRAWFFGRRDGSIPRWAGYSLGYRLVDEYLARMPSSSAAALVDVPAAELLATVWPEAVAPRLAG